MLASVCDGNARYTPAMQVLRKNYFHLLGIVQLNKSCPLLECVNL